MNKKFVPRHFKRSELREIYLLQIYFVKNSKSATNLNCFKFLKTLFSALEENTIFKRIEKKYLLQYSECSETSNKVPTFGNEILLHSALLF